MDIIQTLAQELNLQYDQTERTVALIDADNTIPFIARYRKEVTGSLDDTVLRRLDERLRYLRNLEKRKEEVAAAIREQGKLTPEISAALDAAAILAEVEDLYRPFKQKRKTRASVARQRGLEPLAELLLRQSDTYSPRLETQAESFVSEEHGVPSVQEALSGAQDIIAETVSDDAQIRKKARALTSAYGMICSAATGEEDSVYAQYYDYSEKVSAAPGYRILALNRGEKEGFLKVGITVARDMILRVIFKAYVKNPNSPACPYLEEAIADSYDRLIAPSIEREIRNELTQQASEGAIKVFSENLKNLLMQAPLKGKTVLGFDPGYRTGCKLAVVDKTGKVLDTAVIYPTKPQEQTERSERTVLTLIDRYAVDVIAIGNGTASKESEVFIADTLKKCKRDVRYIVVSEAGASVYSASELAAKEFPDFDVTQRSAVSIARRLQDPLAELVKIDPKAIGVGQYQHDMKQSRLDEALGGVVEDCVNAVGIDINTASHALMSFVAGINTVSAKNIVKYREENGEFHSIQQLKRVPRIGEKAFEQCAGFFRVPESDEILDNTGVHPETYAAAKALLQQFSYTEDDVRQGKLGDLRKKVQTYGAEKLAEELQIGAPTLLDIIKELEKPGRDIRDSLPQPILRQDVMSMEDLKPGMVLTGTVRNVIDFGAFVDIGVHQDGLVHISQICEKFIKHPGEVLSVGDIVQVKVLSVEPAKKRIGLTMKFH